MTDFFCAKHASDKLRHKKLFDDGHAPGAAGRPRYLSVAKMKEVEGELLDRTLTQNAPKPAEWVKIIKEKRMEEVAAAGGNPDAVDSPKRDTILRLKRAMGQKRMRNVSKQNTRRYVVSRSLSCDIAC